MEPAKFLIRDQKLRPRPTVADSTRFQSVQINSITQINLNPMKPATAQKYLSILLTLIGCGLMVAFLCVFIPDNAMAATHKWLGLGDYPDQPITRYLARSTSLLYGVHGLLMFVVGRNLDRYAGLAIVFGWLHVVIGMFMLGIDLTAGMPWYWTAIEGVPIAAAGLLVVWLARKAFPSS